MNAARHRHLTAASTVILTLLLSGCSGLFSRHPPEYPPVAGGVDFEQLQKLRAGRPAQRFAYGPARFQFAELWLPGEATGRPLPVVVFIHGGCWLSRYGIDHARPLATSLAQAGYAVWSLEYRRSGNPGGGWPGTFEDIQAGLAELARQRPAELDLERVLIAGHSAGGHLALLAGSAALTRPGSGVAPRGVIGLAPIVDLAGYALGEGSCQAAAVTFMGGMPAQLPAEYRHANPLALPVYPGTLLLLGRDDRIIPAVDPGLAGARLQWEDAGHFDWIYPGTPAWRVFLAKLEEFLQ